MIRDFIVVLGFVAFSVSSMDLQQARDFFRNDQYEQLLTVEVPINTDVANFCKVFAKKMKKDRKLQGKAKLVIPEWAKEMVDKNVAESFHPIATIKGDELLKQWQPERARLWLHFGTSLGSPALSYEEERYISSMIAELDACKYYKGNDYSELLEGLNGIESFEEDVGDPLPTNPVPLTVSN